VLIDGDGGLPRLKQVYIHGYGAYLPMLRIRASEIGRVWGVGDSELPVKEKAVNNFDEDAATMAVEAAKYALIRAGVSASRIGAVYIGSESHPYAVKPTGTIVAEALGVSRRTLGADLEFACKAGSEAIQIVSGLVSSGMIEFGLAIGSDTAQGRPRDPLEYTAAAGAAAFVLGGKGDGVVGEIEASVSYVSDTPDFWRRSHERYPSHGHRFTAAPAYFHHIVSSVKLLQEEGYSLSDFNYVVFHQPNTKFPLVVAKMLGIPPDKVEQGMVCNVVGNTYAASSLLGLCRVLDRARPGEKVLVASYGSGAGSDAFVVNVLDGVLERRVRAPLVDDLISRKKYVDYAVYLRARNKIRLQ
jgi:hydroxymethylglutaryl-CoA synthase